MYKYKNCYFYNYLINIISRKRKIIKKTLLKRLYYQILIIYDNF